MITYTVVLKDETSYSGLSYEEAQEAMKESEETNNPWARVFIDQTDYKAP